MGNFKKNTAIICLSPFHGGMEMDAVRIAKLLCNDTRVTIIVKHHSPSHQHYEKELTDIGIDFRTIACRTFFSYSIIFGVRKIIKENRIENVIFFGASEMRSLYFSFLGLSINLIVRHGTTKSTPKKDLLHRLVYSNVNWHLAISEHIAENVKYIIPFAKHSQLVTILSSLRKMPKNLPAPSLRTNKVVKLLQVARIAEGKGHIDAIAACEVLYSAGIPFEFHLVGELDENFKKKFHLFLQSIDYKNNIFLHGFSPNVFEYYRDSDIFLHPSEGEGLGNSFLEALSCGLLCIAYNNTALPGIRKAGFKFYLAEDKNCNDLKLVLQQAVSDLNNIPLPYADNVQLARDILSPERERTKLLEILQ